MNDTHYISKQLVQTPAQVVKQERELERAKLLEVRRESIRRQRGLLLIRIERSEQILNEITESYLPRIECICRQGLSTLEAAVHSLRKRGHLA